MRGQYFWANELSGGSRGRGGRKKAGLEGEGLGQERELCDRVVRMGGEYLHERECVAGRGECGGGVLAAGASGFVSLLYISAICHFPFPISVFILNMCFNILRSGCLLDVHTSY